MSKFFYVYMAARLYEAHVPYHVQKQDVQLIGSVELVRHARGFALVDGVFFCKLLQPTSDRICIRQHGVWPSSEILYKRVYVLKAFTAAKIGEENGGEDASIAESLAAAAAFSEY